MSWLAGLTVVTVLFIVSVFDVDIINSIIVNRQKTAVQPIRIFNLIFYLGLSSVFCISNDWIFMSLYIGVDGLVKSIYEYPF